MTRATIPILLTALAAAGCGGGRSSVSRPAPGPSAESAESSPGEAASRAAVADEIVFAVAGDSRGGSASVEADGGGGINERELARVLDHVLEQDRARLVVFTGDTVQGATSADRLALQLARWNELVDPYREAGLELLITAGNHEIDDGTRRELEPAREGAPTAEALANQRAMLAAFPDQPLGNGPADGGFTYWVRRGPALFVVLDSFRPGHFNTVDTAWLEGVLADAATGGDDPPAHVFVATHAPAWPAGGHMLDSLSNYNADRAAFHAAGLDIWPWEPPGSGGPRDVDVDWRHRRDAFWEILVRHRVTALLAGHEHNLSRQRVDGVWQIISGGLANHLYEINERPVELYGGAAQNPRAGDTLWGAAAFGYVLITARADGTTRAEAWGYTDDDPTMRRLDELELR